MIEPSIRSQATELSSSRVRCKCKARLAAQVPLMCATYAITGVLPSSLLVAVSSYLCNLEWHEPAQGQPLCVEAQVLRLEQRRSRKQPKAARKPLKDQVAVSKKLLTGIITGEPETRVYSGPVTLERYSSCQLSGT